MKLFLKNILHFVLPIILVLISVEFALRGIPNSYKQKSYQLNNSVENIEVLALGSSHTLYSINPKYFVSKTFNAANISQSPDIDLAILNTYESQFKNLKAIVIRLSYDTLFEELLNSNEDWRLKDYKLYTDIKYDYKFRHNSEVLAMGMRQSLEVLKTYYLDSVPLPSCDSLGWGNDIKSKPKMDLEKAGKIAAKRHTASKWNLLEKNIKRFESIMLWSKRRGINVYLITFPAYHSYRNNLNDKQLEKMISVGEELEHKFSNCKYFNFLSHKDFTESDFHDGDHLNENGSRKISTLINSLL